MVEKFDSEIRRVLDYCRLPWQPARLECIVSASDRDASAAQVRRPLYDSSLKLWEKYHQVGLRPLHGMVIEVGISETELSRQDGLGS